MSVDWNPELREELRALVEDGPTVSAKAHVARVELGLVLALKEVDRLTLNSVTLLHLVSEANAKAVDLQVTLNRITQENESIQKRFLALALTADCNLCRCTDCVPG